MRIDKENLIIFIFSILIIYVNIFLFIKLEEVPQKAEYLPGIFVTVLPTITALIFPAFFRNLQEGVDYARSDEKYVACYLCMFILGIIFALVSIVNLTVFLFKLSLILFLDCLLLLPLYIFIFIRIDVLRVMEKVRNSIINGLDRIPFISRKIKEDDLKEKISDLARITLRALNNHNYFVLDHGIRYLININDEIMRRTEIDARTGNSLTKEVMRCFRNLGIACVEKKSDEYSRRIGKYMSKIIIYGVRNQKNFEYPNLVLCLEKLGIAAARKHLEETTDEILNSLGQIGDLSVKTNLQRPPILAVLKSLQNIGIVCAEERMVHQCATARTRLLGIARLGKQEERENIFHEALKRFWVVTALMYTHIPEVEEAIYELENNLKKQFGNIFVQTIDETIEMLHIEGEWAQKQIVKEFKNASKIFGE